jgi:hypothetical protein
MIKTILGERGYLSTVRVCCPTCKDNMIHSVGVELVEKFARNEKDPVKGWYETFGTVVTVRRHHVTFSNEAEKRSKGESHSSISIRLTCENGCDDFLIFFFQDQAGTYVDCEVLNGAGCTHIRSFEDAS